MTIPLQCLVSLFSLLPVAPVQPARRELAPPPRPMERSFENLKQELLRDGWTLVNSDRPLRGGTYSSGTIDEKPHAFRQGAELRRSWSIGHGPVDYKSGQKNVLAIGFKYVGTVEMQMVTDQRKSEGFTLLPESDVVVPKEEGGSSVTVEHDVPATDEMKVVFAVVRTELWYDGRLVIEGYERETCFFSFVRPIRK